VLVAAILYHVRHLGTLFTETTNDTLRTAQGHTLAWWVVAALVVAFAGQALAALAQRRWPLRARSARLVGIAVLVVLVAMPIAFGAYYFPRHGGLDGWVRVHYDVALSGSGPANSAGRLTSLGSSGRVPWYREAVKGFEAHKIAGTGAGTFRFTNYLYRDQVWVVRHSHSQWLNVLSELGLVGFVLFVVAIGGLVVAALGRLLKDRTDPERSLLAACQAAVVVFVVHMSIDWDWDMAVITVAFLLLAGVAAAYVRQRGRAAEVVGEAVSDTPREGAPTPRRFLPTPRRFPLAARILVTGLVALGVVAWGLPYLSQRAARTAVNDASRGRLAQAAASARQAGRLDPLAVDPLITLALVQVEQRRPAAARQTLDAAVHLQPGNYEPYYQMGLLELNSFGDKAVATQWFRRALALDPLDGLTRAQLGLS
jgi:O-antigen ligase